MDLNNIKDQLLNNGLLKKDLGPFEEEKNNLGNATALIIKRMDVKIMICSVGQSIRGMRHNQHRPDLIILDDIEDQDSVKTREGRNKTFDWLTGDIIPAGTNKTRIVAIGNLLHEDCVLKRLEKKIENEELKRMNGIYREYPIIDDKGNPLWPSKYPTPESIEEEHEKTLDEIAWQREFMLKIVSSDEQIISMNDIQWYDEIPKGKLGCVCIGVDLAISQKASADFPAIVVSYVYNSGEDLRVYVRPYPFHSKVSIKELLEHLKNIVSTEQMNKVPVKVFMESNGMQDAIVQLAKEDSYGIIGVPSITDKASRLRVAAVPMKKKQVFFPEIGCVELIDELTGFGKENHDDLADAFSISMIKIIEKYGKKPSVLFG
jgi:predicted phage terminase large subunit-like protein